MGALSRVLNTPIGAKKMGPQAWGPPDPPDTEAGEQQTPTRSSASGNQL